MVRPIKLAAVSLVLMFGLIAQGARADDCETIRTSTSKGLRQDRWHTVNRFEAQGKTMTLELLRADGQLYMRSEGGAWKKSPLTIDAVVKQNEDMIAKGQLTFAGCKKAGSEKLPQGKADRYEYLTGGPGGPPVSATVWIGSGDGLPYRSQSAQTVSTTTYTGVTAPQ